MSFAPLLAGVDDVIGIIVFVVIIIVSAISQAAGKKQQAPPQPRPRPRPPVRPAQAGQGQARPGGQRAGPVAQELEDFLRRAAGGRQPARQQPPRQQPVRAPQARPVARPVVAQPVEVVDELEVIESVADHVSHAVDETRLPSHLSRRAEVDEDQVNRKFEHQMGRLRPEEAEAAHAVVLSESEHGLENFTESLPPTGAAGLAAMLGSSASLRQAILISEILNRPEHRWS